MIETHLTDRTVATMLALTGGGAPPLGVAGAGVNGLAVPGMAVLPWFDIGVLNRGR